MSKQPATAVKKTSLKWRKPVDDISPDTLRAQALSKSVDVCINCNKHCTNMGRNSKAI